MAGVEDEVESRRKVKVKKFILNLIVFVSEAEAED